MTAAEVRCCDALEGLRVQIEVLCDELSLRKPRHCPWKDGTYYCPGEMIDDHHCTGPLPECFEAWSQDMARRRINAAQPPLAMEVER